MKNRVFTKMLTFCITATMLLFSCSSDDNDNSENNDNAGGNNNIGNFVALPAADIGNYEGSFITTKEGEESISGGGAIATLIDLGGNVYGIDFNVDITTLSGLQFIMALSPNPDNIFTTIEEDFNRTGIGAVLIDIEGGIRTLTVTIEMDTTTIAFTGRKL